MTASSSNLLLSLPPSMTPVLAECEPRTAARVLAFHDPAGIRLGSGGGTAHVLHQAWLRGGGGASFPDWLGASLKTVLHGGGESCRLPAYAAPGKLFLPMPVFRWTHGQQLDQRLLDLQDAFLARIRQAAAPSACCLIASGDVLLRSEADLPPLPAADVVLLGLWAGPEEARRFGVFFCDRDCPQRLDFFLQKPTPREIRERAVEQVYLLDVGVWLLSQRAVACLMKKCGWDAASASFPGGGRPHYHDLYGEWALHLGRQPALTDPEVSSLSVAVVPLADGEFYHFGTSREMIDSSYRLQTRVVDQLRLGALGVQPYPKQFVQNALFEPPLRREENHTLWVENSHVPASWTLASEHVLTGIPPNEWTLALEPGVCLDFVPVDKEAWVVRAYGIDDPFRGDCAAPDTCWLGRPLAQWFRDRGLEKELAAWSGVDIQRAPLHPAITPRKDDAPFLRWLYAANPQPDETHRRRWLNSRRHSAAELGAGANLGRLYAQRNRFAAGALPRMARNPGSIFYRMDLRVAAECFAASGADLPPPWPVETQPLTGMHDRMFRSEVARRKGHREEASALEGEAFGILRDCIVREVRRRPVSPRPQLLSDQIAWGRCPIRLDLAGGWTDTPPYCLEFGGSVVNVALDLNGQPPIQVFARMVDEPRLTVRSIDQGVEERIDSFDRLLLAEGLGGGFLVARAAFALAGFHPRFCAGSFASLEKQLRAFGGGLELSMLSAVPKGSGLGVSSILAATLLGVLSDACGLAWDHVELMARVSALEQLLTSGGGWQDQWGGVLPGVKHIETKPGMDQRPTLRWLPERFFSVPEFRDAMALYYTGITRIAHNVLGEIVRGLFLNDNTRLRTIDAIRRNAARAQDAVQRQDFEAFTRSVAQSWTLNQELDSGTNPPAVQAVIDRCGPELAACKLAGAGGGGYLFFVARDADAMQVIRRRLSDAPPNPRARFVDVSLSAEGLQITRS